MLEEGKALIGTLSRLKYDMARDRALEPMPADGEALVDEYNAELARLEERGQNTWFTAPWLYAECYLYRLLRSLFATSEHWKLFDPFFAQKLYTYKGSGTAVHRLAVTLAELESEKHIIANDPEKLKVLFHEMAQMCLWGNATDLSLLTNMTPEDIENLQTIGRDAQDARKEFILKDDQNAAWEHITTLKDARIDFVLDNAGFELFTDLIFADFLVSHTPFVSKVVFHPKSIPWFVSDVTPPDFAALLDVTSLPLGPASEQLERAVARWNAYLADGTFALSVPRDAAIGAQDEIVNFWTSPWPYWDIRLRAPKVWDALCGSGLVIFKGDLNYRKLTGDVRWPVDTPFETAVGPLAGAFPLLSLRTSKADVVVGIPRSVAEALDARDEKWRTNGRYALVSFVPRGES
ncbi:DUF89 domain-containing protein [Russula ochroleuca]|uniref:Sugar phosphate phosphatase n=1 Tax=Russula ochroleuca TaxID=152965 RepID=A0A9P5TEB1_9AGAM|nr:DUF89 domain-containing protein [Russula ochroleuca]